MVDVKALRPSERYSATTRNTYAELHLIKHFSRLNANRVYCGLSRWGFWAIARVDLW